MKIKICGMRERENIRNVAKCGPSHMGFIFYDKSPRWVGDDFQLPDDFPEAVRKVGVFVNAGTNAILNKIDFYDLDAVQLHGDEPVAQCREIKDKAVEVWKVFSVDSFFNFDRLRAYQEVSDYFLFDTKGDHYGGNGAAFDWNILKRYDLPVPWFLSGGLTPVNYKAALELDLPMLSGLDFNSGVEISAGLKDIQKIRSIEVR